MDAPVPHFAVEQCLAARVAERHARAPVKMPEEVVYLRLAI